MCLLTKDKEWRIAKKNIPCYVARKVLFKQIRSPFYSYTWWTIGNRRTADGNDACLKGTYWTKREIGHGVFHSFIHKKDAYTLCNVKTKHRKPFKAYIPKGTKYCVGIAHRVSNSVDGAKVYGSRKLVLIEQLPDELEEVRCKKK